GCKASVRNAPSTLRSYQSVRMACAEPASLASAWTAVAALRENPVRGSSSRRTCRTGPPDTRSPGMGVCESKFAPNAVPPKHDESSFHNRAERDTKVRDVAHSHHPHGKST